MTPALSLRLNALGLLAVCAVLTFAFADQLFLADLPCPLCILQRAGFVIAGFGLALNLRFGPRPSHYALVLIGALAGAVIASRQILIHIVPGTGTYGHEVLGLHFYSWAFVIFVVMVLGTAVMLLFDRQFTQDKDSTDRQAALSNVAFVLFGLLALGNGLSTVLECAGGLCPDNPTEYLLLR
ncbi:MAG: disulfide bond formation protein B [Xanthobacteraceae bacterium]|nr:disulfide bond formation protein B [Xanthobacteraceae bacterium]